jgi:hypothetical protein
VDSPYGPNYTLGVKYLRWLGCPSKFCFSLAAAVMAYQDPSMCHPGGSIAAEIGYVRATDYGSEDSYKPPKSAFLQATDQKQKCDGHPAGWRKPMPKQKSDIHPACSRCLTLGVYQGVFAYPLRKVHYTQSGGVEPACVRPHLRFRYGRSAHRASQNDHCEMARHYVSTYVSDRLAHIISDVLSFHGAV